MWDQVTVVFAESVGPSDRGRWDQVTVDKSHFSKRFTGRGRISSGAGHHLPFCHWRRAVMQRDAVAVEVEKRLVIPRPDLPKRPSKEFL